MRHVPCDHVVAAKTVRRANRVRAKRRRHQALAFVVHEIADGVYRMDCTPMPANGLHAPTAAFLIGVHAWRDGHGDNVFSAREEPVLEEFWRAGYEAARAIDIAATRRSRIKMVGRKGANAGMAGELNLGT